MISTREVGNAVAFLASDDASGITGAALYVDGGRLGGDLIRVTDRESPKGYHGAEWQRSNCSEEAKGSHSHEPFIWAKALAFP